MVNLFQLDANEKVNTVIPLNDYDSGYLMMATKEGLIKKTAISEFESIRKSGKIAIVLEENDELVSVLKTSGEDELLIASREGKCLRFAEQNVRPIGRVAKGVKSMDLSGDDRIVDLLIVNDESKVLAITEKGYGKRTPLTDYRLQNRGGKGVKAGILNDKTGKLVALKIIGDGQEVLVISVEGTMIRTRGDEISVMSRDTIGVHIMDVAEGDSVTSVAILDPEEAEDENTEIVLDEGEVKEEEVDSEDTTSDI